MRKHTTDMPVVGQVVLMVLLLLLNLNSALAGVGTSYVYDVNLNQIVKDRYHVKLECSQFAQDTLVYHFPWIIPGTYMEANYGKFIHDLKVFDQSGKPLKAERKGKNTYIITPANQIGSIEYWVSATWEIPRMRIIYPMAGTGVIPDRVFAINGGGVFGYFQGFEKTPVSMNFDYPEHLYAMTVLDQTSNGPGAVNIKTADYDELIDSPILFAYPDTAHFKVNDMDVMVGYSHENDDTRRADELSQALNPSMLAIASYIDSLPGDEYAYLIHYKDAHEMGEILDKPRFIVPKAIWYVMRYGIPLGGALEHNKSSFYFLADPGSRYTEAVTRLIEDISIHEFMHILTPLNLHSQYIDNWDYVDPQMSKHLWLYEGVTEYMAEIIKVNGGMTSPKEFLLGNMRSKIRRGEKYPFAEMSFTEMSSNILEKPYKRQFNQVYQRGAVLGMLLDIEIIRLTEGRKRLIDVMLELAEEYGPSRPMDEEGIFDLFTARVHPDLRTFFARYIEGHEPLPYAEILDHVGVNYVKQASLSLPRDPIKDNKVKTAALSTSRQTTIKRVGKDDWLGLQPGDRYAPRLYMEHYFDDFGNPWPEGMAIQFEIERKGQEVMLHDTITYIEKEVEHHMSIRQEMTPEQALYFDIWLGFQPPLDAQSATRNDKP